MKFGGKWMNKLNLKTYNNECWLKMIPVYMKQYEVNIYANNLTIYVS